MIFFIQFKSTANAFADLSDSDALEAYKISKISSKDLKK